MLASLFSSILGARAVLFVVKATCRYHLVITLMFCLLSLPVLAAPISDIAATKHNLSVTGTGTVTATSDDQICVFCHTPHGASAFPGAPLWNRQLSNQTYTTYTSSSLDAEDIMGQLDQPGGSSKLCLSCHDGTLAIGTVNVLGGQQNVDIRLSGTEADGTMPPGSGLQTGFTRDLGTDLTNDHPISLTYDTNLANIDRELFDPVVAAHIGVRAPGIRPLVPLEATGIGGTPQIQCATCHDPHSRDTDLTVNSKFLRLNRFQQAAPVGGAFDAVNDIVCLSCHDKDGWNTSAHASPVVANEAYTVAEADLREFPVALPVWQASCLNCHDTHSVHGSRRLLREGTDAVGSPKSGGNPALEETCYQCHSAIAVVSNASGEIKDIQSDFLLARRMPITSADQAAGTEVHDISDADFIESTTLLGKFNLTNRHAECTDCHNPHRVMRNSLFNDTGNALEPTHDHSAGHSNIASGALRGSWGVEPVYGATEFPSLPLSYQLKTGDGGIGASTAVNSNWVTREYQICLKCHSDFGYSDNNAFPTGNRPNLSVAGGGTPPNAKGLGSLTQYTNQAMEFQTPLSHTGEPGGLTGSGAGSNFEGGAHFNHRSWHPVMRATGRTPGLRNANGNVWVAPWENDVGSQTMYCSDCHGSDTTAATVVPAGNNPWGPHGSNNDFILKGSWDRNTGNAATTGSGLCFKCHEYAVYASENSEGRSSGFSGAGESNLHAFHAKRVGKPLQCMWCHVAVPHGWKNKALLVNLNDVGAEAGLPANTEIAIGGNADVYNQEPYYFNAKLKIRTFAQSGQWQDTNCGSAGANIPGNTTTVGKDWMDDVCSNPP
ncbi:hypothetical protein JYT79_00510 [Cardiobacterium sp. AH-315-I02]|nr:hypothetical protein [Cardiobacterium sp. AH-315-I02]